MFNSLENTGCFIIKREDILEKKVFFSGMAFLENCIIHNNEGFKSYLEDNVFDENLFYEGRFSLFAKSKNNFIAQTDLLGQDILYYYLKNDYWIISNSFLAIVKILVRKGFKEKIYLPSLLQPFLRHNLGQQLLSNNTSIENIKVLPKDYKIVVCPDTKKINITKIKYTASNNSYEDYLNSFCHKWVNRIYALSNAYPKCINVDITGGKDSRVILGLLLKSKSDLSKINFKSNKNLKDDYLIADKLANHYGFKINNLSLKQPTINTNDSYNIWKFGNLGCYNNIYIPYHKNNYNNICFHGGGGESFRASFSNPPSKYIDFFRRNIKNDFFLNLVNDEFLNAIKNLNNDINDPNSLINYYQNFRSRFHSGRSWVRNCSATMLTPLASQDLINAFNLLDKEEQNNGKLICDLYMILDPFLATFPFDKPDKVFSNDVINKSKIYSNNNKIQLKALEVFNDNNIIKDNLNNKDRVTLENFRELLINDLKQYKDIVIKSGIINNDYFQLALNSITGNSISLSKVDLHNMLSVKNENLNKVVHIILIGELSNLYDKISLEKQVNY